MNDVRWHSREQCGTHFRLWCPAPGGALHPIGTSANSLNRPILTLLHTVQKTRLCGGEVPLLGDWVMGADVIWSLDDRVQVRVICIWPLELTRRLHR
jgi:hypothetical protein